MTKFFFGAPETLETFSFTHTMGFIVSEALSQAGPWEKEKMHAMWPADPGPKGAQESGCP